MATVRTVVAVLVALAGLTSCSVGEEPRGDGAATSTPSASSAGPSADVTSPPTIKAGDRYVALGDSYTSGPQLGKATGQDGCRQSAANYPHRLARALRLELTDVSCGSAQLRHLRVPQKTRGGSAAPQFDALTADTRLVTLSMGANESALFGTVVITCAGKRDAQPDSQPDSQPCTDWVAERSAQLDRVFARITSGIKGAIAEIRKRSPEARVMVVGYPQIIPSSGRCAALPLAAVDYDVARGLFNKVNTAVRSGAKAGSAEFVDLTAATTGHDICGKDPWIAGATVDPARRGFLFHPYAEEQVAVAGVLKQQLG